MQIVPDPLMYDCPWKHLATLPGCPPVEEGSIPFRGALEAQVSGELRAAFGRARYRG